MPALHIISKPLDDQKTPEDFPVKAELELTHMYVLQNGTTSGDTSITFRLQDADGNQYLAQLTGNLWRTANIAYTAFDAKFKDVPPITPNWN